jgi:hypothetical protein
MLLGKREWRAISSAPVFTSENRFYLVYHRIQRLLHGIDGENCCQQGIKERTIRCVNGNHRWAQHALIPGEINRQFMDINYCCGDIGFRHLKASFLFLPIIWKLAASLRAPLLMHIFFENEKPVN